MDVTARILNHDTLIQFFGSWPSFHDAKVVRYEYDHGAGVILLTLRTSVMTEQIDEKGYFKSKDHSLVTFRFGGGTPTANGRIFSGQYSVWIEHFTRAGP